MVRLAVLKPNRLRPSLQIFTLFWPIRGPKNGANLNTMFEILENHFSYLDNAEISPESIFRKVEDKEQYETLLMYDSPEKR